MSCLITSGRARGCKDNMGGILWAVFFNYANGQGIATVTGSDTVTYTKDSDPIASGVIEEITMESGKVGYKYVPQKNTSSWTDEPQVSVENGTSLFIPTLNMLFAKNEATLRNQMLLLARGEVQAVVKDRNNKFWLLGFHNGLSMNTGNGASSGVGAGDMNGWNISLIGEERVPAYEIFDTDVATTEAMLNSVIGGDSGSGFGV